MEILTPYFLGSLGSREPRSLFAYLYLGTTPSFSIAFLRGYLALMYNTLHTLSAVLELV